MDSTALTSPREAALAYRQEFGWSVLPLNPASKKPLVPWTALEAQPADDTTIRDWWRRYPCAGVGVVTGAVSGLWVVDVDSPVGQAQLVALDVPTTPTATTGKGRHLYFTFPGDLRNTAGKVAGLDTRGDGGYVVAPPTVHPSGRPYAWEASPWETPLAAPPAGLVNLFRDARTGTDTRGGRVHRVPVSADNLSALGSDDYAELLRRGSVQGRRHDDMIRLVGHLLAHGLSKREVAVLLRPWVDRCRPPFPYQELYQTIRDLADAEARNHPERAGRVGPASDDGPDADGPHGAIYEPLAPSYAGTWRRLIHRGRSTNETGAP